MYRQATQMLGYSYAEEKIDTTVYKCVHVLSELSDKLFF